VQTTPHAPQLWGSLPVFTHAPLQQTSPMPHVGLQLPPPLEVEPELLPLPPEVLPPLAEELPPLADEPPLVLDPEPLPPELLPLEPLPSDDPSLPPLVVDPPHCDAGTSSAPRSTMHSGHFGRTIIVNVPSGPL
jgi:hypothetical protein